MKALIAACLMIFLANIVFTSISEAAPASAQQISCPEAESAAEHDLVLEEGPLVIEKQIAPSTCLQRVIDREKKALGNKEEDADFLVWYMDSVMKAEYERVTNPL